MYNSYEEYMRSVLGLNMPNTYVPNNNEYYYEPRVSDANLPEINKLYPEIYGIVYPMVQKVCSRRNFGMINDSLISEMVNEVYDAIEPREETIEGRESTVPMKNGDVKNPRVKTEVRRPNNNFLLRDLIRILIIRELLQGRPGNMGWSMRRT